MSPKSAAAFNSLIGLTALICGAMLPASGQKMTVRRERHHDVSPAVRDLPAGGSSVRRREVDRRRSFPMLEGVKPGQQDLALQRLVAPKVAATAKLNFDGLGRGVFGFKVLSIPPDTNGAVSLTQYVQWVNTSFAIFSKFTGVLLHGPVAGNELWTGFGAACETDNNGDPIVTYDKLANRWIFSQFAIGGTPYLQCVAVSTTPDATGTYNRYAFQYTDFDDSPKMAVWPDAYFTTFNMYDGNKFLGADACAYDRKAMLNGQAATQICFQQKNSVGDLQPSDLDGTVPPPPGAPDYMLAIIQTVSLSLYKFHVDFGDPAKSTFLGPISISVTPFTPTSLIAQNGTTQALEPSSGWLMYRLAYRNFGDHESLVLNHSVAAGSGGGIRWYEIRDPNGTPIVVQQGTFAPDSNFRWLGSIAMDSAGDIAVGYSLSSNSLFPSIAFTGRTPSDPPNTMESEAVIANGGGSQTGSDRWGDYSAMQVDPVDDCTFWFTSEYLNTTGSYNWNTRIASFRFPNCTPKPMNSFLAIGNGSNQSLQLIGLEAVGGIPYVADWQDNGGDWHAGQQLPPQLSKFSSLAIGNGAHNYLELIGAGADGLVYLVAWQDSSGTWHPGFELPEKIAKFSSVVVGNGDFNYLMVLGLSDGLPYLVAWEDNDGSWHAGFQLPGKTTKFSSLAVGNGSNNNLQVVGIGSVDGLAYLAAWEDNDGGWHAGSQLPGQSTKFSSLAVARGSNNDLQVIALGAADGLAYLAAWQDGLGNWHPGSQLPGQSTKFSSLAVARGSNNDLQVIALGAADGLAYLAAWQDGLGNWHPGLQLPDQSTKFSSIAVARGNNNDLQIIGLGAVGGLAYVAAWQDGLGNWHPGLQLP